MEKLKDKEMEVIRINDHIKPEAPLLAFKTNDGEVGVILEDKEDRYFDKEDVKSAVEWLKDRSNDFATILTDDEYNRFVKIIDEAFEDCLK